MKYQVIVNFDNKDSIEASFACRENASKYLNDWMKLTLATGGIIIDLNTDLLEKEI